MLEIEALALRLPHFLRADASFIARGVADAIADAELGFAGTIEVCTVPPIVLAPGTTPALAVKSIAGEVVRTLTRLEP